MGVVNNTDDKFDRQQILPHSLSLSVESAYLPAAGNTQIHLTCILFTQKVDDGVTPEAGVTRISILVHQCQCSIRIPGQTHIPILKCTCVTTHILTIIISNNNNNG